MTKLELERLEEKEWMKGLKRVSKVATALLTEEEKAQGVFDPMFIVALAHRIFKLEKEVESLKNVK